MTDRDDSSRAGPARSSAPKRRYGLLFGLALVAIAVIAVLIYVFDHGSGSAPTAAAPGAPPVDVSRALTKSIVEWDEYTGQFAPVEFVELRARVSGYLTEIHFQDGQTVKKGDLLFVIDPRPYEIALASAKAGLEQATARLELANRQLARAGQLRERDFVAQSTYDERLQEVRAAGAAVETARAEIRSAELNLDFTHITAPVAGRVSQREVSVGNLVTGSTGGSGGTPTLLTRIVSLSPIYFTFDMSEADYLAHQRAVAAGRLQSTGDKGFEVFARLTDETEWKRSGQLDFLDNQLDRTAGTIRARATFANADMFLTPGQFARLRVPATDLHQVLLVPDSALVTDQSNKLVMTVGPENVVAPKLIEAGPLVDGLRVIRPVQNNQSKLGTIDPSDKIIIRGIQRARPGAKVTPNETPLDLTPAAPPAPTTPVKAG
jgi:RND family efflux transporter MFP subunit